jgi:uncharacterized protein HemY
VSAYSRGVQLRPADFEYLLLAQALDATGEKEQAAAARQKAALLSSDIRVAQRHADDLLSH